MFSPLRNRFGIPGVISTIALVFAMLGGAYAASDSNSGEASASAKRKGKAAKRGPRGPRGKRGPAGPAGPQGPVGPQGAPGANGKDGAPGQNGANGTSVSSEEFGTAGKDGKCVGTGGTKFTSASGSSYACNGAKGKEGSPWTAGGTLPEGATLTGTYGPPELVFEEFPQFMEVGTYLLPISFEIPLSAAPELVFVPGVGSYGSAPGSGCPGVVADVPSADKGKLCVYGAGGGAFTPASATVTAVAPEPGVGATSVTPAGTILKVTCVAGEAPVCTGTGLWAVTG